MSFPPYLWEFFDKKNQKTLNVGKIRKYDEETVFFWGKNILIFQNCIFTKLAQNMPVVAGRLL